MAITFLPYYGGKSGYHSADIIKHFPEHEIYVEPFGGMAGILLNKPPSKQEVYNDLNGDIVNLFRVVRERPQDLIDVLELTPYSRQEWQECNAKIKAANWLEYSDVERARCVFVALAMSFSGLIGKDGWCFGGAKHDVNIPLGFYNRLDKIKTVSGRFNSVLIENYDALKLIGRYDTPDTLFYLDPPYPHVTREPGNTGNRTRYIYELSNQQHINLLNLCLELKAKIIISTYPNELYSEMLIPGGWELRTFGVVATSALQSERNGLKGKSQEAAKRTECLWINPAAQGGQLKLWA